MKNLFKGTTKNILESIPLSVYTRLIKRDVVGLFFHAVSDEPMLHIKHLYPPATISSFEQMLKHLVGNYNPVTYDQLQSNRTGGSKLPAKAVHLSFDDGFTECFQIVRPLLLDFGIPCTFFIITDLIDNRVMFYRNKVSLCIERLQNLDPPEYRLAISRIKQMSKDEVNDKETFVVWLKGLQRSQEESIDEVCSLVGLNVDEYLQNHQLYLTRQQIKQMADEGFTIGSHSMSHPKLGMLNPRLIEEQIVDSSMIIREITGASTIPFSFPNSAGGINRKDLSRIRTRNPNLGLFFDTQNIQQDVNFMVNRIWIERYIREHEGVTLPDLLHSVYIEQAVDNLRRFRGR
jgi:peptidoglycan/xylan/chitin deacetylase (PgdA/CDA1 family)